MKEDSVMKIQIASDLHLEFLQKRFPGERIITAAADADFLVLAGDIGNGTQAIELFKDWPVPVIYLAGNHEFYGQLFESTRNELRNEAAGTNITFLDCNVANFEGVRFLGTTLWTDYRLSLNRTQHQLMDNAQARLNDHRAIKCIEGLFTTQRALAEHDASRTWLSNELSQPHDGKTVVVSHHGPHPLSVHSRYGGEPLNAAFVSDLTELLGKADLWIHGHVHDSFDYRVEHCRVVTNPAGYAKNRNLVSSAEQLIFENANFNWACVVEV